MARKPIDIGAIGNDGTGDSIRDAFRKVNDNFRELYSSLGLGDRLTFKGLDDTPDDYEGQDNAIISVNAALNGGDGGLVFRQLVSGDGIQINVSSSEIEISSQFAAISADPSPQLGGNLSARSGGNQYRILDLATPISDSEAVNKAYADTKISKNGINAIDPETGTTNSSFGIMSGPLILSRDPEPDDDEAYGGLIAATKRYVDNSAFGSVVNLYVATSGSDFRVGVSQSVQGRALAYAYRTLEAALKRAEEIMLESRKEIGPYKKVLTFNDGAGDCTLTDIDVAPASGAGFTGEVLMSVDTATINSVGLNYSIGDIITVSGGTFIEPARYQVLSTTASPGGVIALKQLSSGVYTSLPGSTNVSTSNNSVLGGATQGLTLNLTYRVNNVRIPIGGNGSGYGLVSVRIIGGGGTGAFGTADVVGGSIQSITITDGGRGFTSLPNVVVNLPRFLIRTDGYRTDFTGDVTSETTLAERSRDIREGLYLRGETSGALAQILSHSGELDDDGNELFDVDIQYGNFEVGEVISYGDVARTTQISVLVESGIYEENLPLRVPQNVSIVGDEFRRVIIRPKPGVSSSPWAFLHFRRDTSVDGLTTAEQEFGYHYLTDSSEPVYPLINNKGYYRSAAQLLSLNRQFIQKEIIAWINDQKQNNITPFSSSFLYNEDLCERDIGLLLDSMIFDLKWGGSNRTVSAALKYYQQASELGDPSIAVNEQQAETNAAIIRVNTLAQLVIRNIEISDLYQTDFLQITDGAFIAEVGSGGTSFTITAASNTTPVAITTGSSHGLNNGEQIVISEVEGMTELNGVSYYVEVVNSTTLRLFRDAALLEEVDGTEFGEYTTGGYATNLGGVLGSLFSVVLDIIDPESESYNLPKNNNQMDMMLCNDAVRFQAVTFQGHGGFAMVLDPEGQILAKSPYAQECASFCKSTGRQTFGGGMFIDGFAGNLQFQILSKDSDTFLRVGGLKRFPQLPASFIVNDVRYRINYVRDFTFNIAGSTASFVLDETTPWPFSTPDLNTYEVLMPGNRSMLGNDYTQINDLGYGIIATNGGLCEAVSVFTYYCHISFYSLNGGQIRSVSSSSAHGNFALVAEGSDPLEIPSETTTYFDFAQGCTCYFPSGAYANEVEGLIIFVTDYEYVPLGSSELEIDHGDGSIYRYPVTGVSTAGMPPGVAKLSLASSTTIGTDGLAAIVPNGTKMTIRQNSQIILTGDVVNVATRPSTGLVFTESPDVYRVLQFESYDDTTGEKAAVITVGNPTVINNVGHGLLAGYQVKFTTTGSLPTGLTTTNTYFVISTGLTADSFRISETKGGTAVVTSGVQSGTHSYTVQGLSRTILRENYNYIDLAVWPTQPFITSSATCTFSIADPGVVTRTNHGFNEGDVIRFTTTGKLPSPIIISRHYFVKTVLGLNTFTITDIPGGDAIETTGTQTGIHSVGKVIGRVGDSTIAVVPISDNDAARVINSTLVWIGEKYTVSGYQGKEVTGQEYGLLTLSTPLLDSVINYENLPTLKSAGQKGLFGTLTIRISLTRVTGHDLLEIGTGSYADTNYPNEIYGSSVNPLNQAQETRERGVGRVFYATTDQYGNFNVGPYFRVDQGTGTVTFAANIALTQLDGLGFKRGVSISEFSIDSTFSDNAPDTVPTENATRIYLEKRLGITHNGSVVSPEERIPSISGGFLALNGQLAMEADIDVNGFKVVNLANPVTGTDAVNLQSLTFGNISDITTTSPDAGDLLVFTGTGNASKNASITGDISFTYTGTNEIDFQLKAGVVNNNEVNASAGIVQSKLSMTLASNRAAAPTGTAAQKQAASGLASFDNTQFNVTDGWVSLKDNGIALGKLAQISASTVLGNNTLVSATPSAIAFSSIVSSGGAILKNQYTGIGYLRRIGLTNTEAADYEIVDHATANTVSTLVRRDSNGDFSAGTVTVTKLQVDNKIVLDTIASTTGGYTQVHGYNGNVGILIGDGSAAGDKASFYDNNSHTFRNASGTANAPVTTGTLTTTAITSGGSTTAGTLTGAWTVTGGLTMQTTSGITFASGTLDMGTGTVQTTKLTSGGTTTVGTITGDWRLATNSKLQATYADLAEYYEGDKEYEVGTVLIFGGDKEVTLSKSAGDYRVAGVVSNNAAYTMNAECPGIKVLIALQGRVPCRVVGKVRKGDLIITSNIAGVAISANGVAQAGTIIGKALQNYDSDHIGTIEVAVGRT